MRKESSGNADCAEDEAAVPGFCGRPDMGELLCAAERGTGCMKKDITIIGNAVVDVLAGPVTPEAFESGSQAVKETKLSFGGDALNEAVILSRFGKRPGGTKRGRGC